MTTDKTKNGKKDPRVMFYHIENPPKGDRAKRFLEIFAAILKNSNYGPALEQYSKVMAKCGRCSTSCHVYRESGDPRDIPCYRTDLILKIYRRYFSYEGAMFSRLTNNFELTEEHIDQLAYSMWTCNACRKCALECPTGIDHGLMTHFCRYVLAEMNIVPRALKVSTREQLEGETGNTSAIPFVAFKDTLEFLEEELEEAFGIPIKFPLDKEGAEYLFLSPVSDYIMEAETLMGIAAALHAGGVDWTIGSKYFDAINYGLFYSDLVLKRVVNKIEEEFNRLGCKKILIGECGHATRSATFVNTYWSKGDPPPIVHIAQLSNKLIKEGKIKLNRDIVKESVTYHDPCNIARQGWIVEEPREIIRAFVNDFREMSPNRDENFCCGGGGGSVSVDETRPYRTTVSGIEKARQITQTGAQYVIAPCANCKKQIREVIDDNKVDSELIGLHDLVLKAIEIEGAKSAEERKEEGL
ncbi:MAG: (Fe-S)-binding protein [Candidatus Kapaibacterium sp.]